jgi:hypothetical protein
VLVANDKVCVVLLSPLAAISLLPPPQATNAAATVETNVNLTKVFDCINKTPSE